MTYRALPALEMAQLREQGMSLRAIGARYGVSGHTVSTRIAGVAPSRLPRVTLPRGPERDFAALISAQPHRFNDPLTPADARALREITGWFQFTQRNGEDRND